MVLAKARASLLACALLASAQLLATYRLEAGYRPPSAARVPSSVRMSTSTWASPVFSSCEMVGSVVMPAWMRSCLMAAMKLLPAPTGSSE